MKITGGTKKAISLLEKLQQQGDLIDVYSKSFFDRLPSAQDKQKSEHHREDFEYLLENYENDIQSDKKPLGHLLFINTSHLRPDLKNLLTQLYKPFANFLGLRIRNPDFIIINLFTKQVLCIGLGRKNRIFAFDAVTEEQVNVFGLLGGQQTSFDRDYVNRFTEHDVSEFVSDLTHSLYRLGLAMYNYDSTIADQEQLEYTLYSGPNENGFYQLKGLDDEILDDEEYSKEEVVKLIDEIKGYQREEDESMEVINLFFPECYQGDLNTGAY